MPRNLFSMVKFFLFVLISWEYPIDCHSSSNHRAWKISGDWLQLAIPACAFGSTLILKDFRGSREFGAVFFATGTTAYGLKYLINERRPHKGNHSFPSGHAAIAFYSSGFIHMRYGWQYAIPAYAAAAFVGYSRLKAHKHWVHDVIGGAAIGLLYSVLLTTPYSCKFCQIYPSFTLESVVLRCEKEF